MASIIKKIILGLLGVVLPLNFVFGQTSSNRGVPWAKEPQWASTRAPGQVNSRYRPYSRDFQRGVVSPFSPGSNNVALDVGQVFLMGDLSESYSDNLGFQLHYVYGVSDIFGFDSSLGHSSHSDGTFSLTTFKAGLRTNLSWYDKVVPSFNFGLGFFRPSYQITPTADVSPVLFGIYLGPGIDLQMTDNLFFGASLTFHDIFGKTERSVKGPKEVGGTFIAFFLHAGVTF